MELFLRRRLRNKQISNKINAANNSNDAKTINAIAAGCTTMKIEDKK